MLRIQHTILCASLAAVGACSAVTGASRDSFSASVSAPVDSVMRVARTQLMHHGYSVVSGKDGSLFTTPRPLAKYQVAGDTALKRRSYTLHVEAGKRLLGGASVNVHGYVLPIGASVSNGTLPAGAMVVTDANAALFADVRAAGSWIADEANRMKK